MNKATPSFDFDPDAGLVRTTNRGTYHTKMPRGALVHETRGSADAALWFLRSGDPGNRAKAELILGKLVALQVSDPTDQHFGIWGYYEEEPPAQMAPADWNWADFIGLTLLKILHEHGGALPPELRERVWEAVERASWSIFRRNVGPNYTNIAAMGAAVCLACGEHRANPLLREYGVKRLATLRDRVQKEEVFDEYNSPTYSMVLLVVLEDVLYLVRDPEARAAAGWLWERNWELIAEYFHPGTQQWAGAQSRNYSDWLEGFPARALAARLGVPLHLRQPGGGTALTPDGARLPSMLACPDRLRSRFNHLPACPMEITQVWGRSPDGSPREVGTTWFDEEATLGSISGETTWDQRRVILGYWRTASDAAVRVRARILHNGRNFDSGFVRNSQRGPRLLSGFFFTSNGGDWHPHFDVPSNGTFATQDLRVRYEFEGAGGELRALGANCWCFAAGDRCVVLHTGEIRLGGRLVTRWESGGEGERHWVEGVFHTGSTQDFCPAELADTSAFAAMELIPIEEATSAGEWCSSLNETRREVSWLAPGQQALTVSVPLAAPTKTEALTMDWHIQNRASGSADS